MAYFYFSKLNLENSTNDLSLNAVASNTGMVFSFESDKSFYEILKGQDIFQRLLGKTKSAQLSVLKENLIPDAALQGHKIYMGILPGAEGKIDFLMSTQLKSGSNPMQILNALDRKKVQITPFQKINKLTFLDSSTVFIGIKDELVVISNSAAPVQNVMKAAKLENHNFATYIKENNRLNKNVLASLFLDFNTLPALLKNILSTKINGELSVFNEQNGYAALTYNFSRENLLFNGTTTIVQANNYYKLFENQTGQKIFVNTILPLKTANYVAFAVTDYQQWYKDLTQLRNNRKETEKVDKNVLAINQKYGLNLAKILPLYFKNQFVTFQLSSGEKFGAIALSNGEKVSQLLMDLSAEYAPDIKIFRAAGIAYTYFGDPFKKFEKPYYTIIDNYLIMANNASSIQVFLNSYRNNELLINNSDYQRFNNQLSTATISFYVGNKNSSPIFGRNLKPPYFKQYQTEFDGFSAFAYQLSGDKGKFLSNLLLSKKFTPDSLTFSP